jgi:hypothetical protein
VLTVHAADRVVELVERLDEVNDVQEIMDLVRSGSSSAAAPTKQ